MSNAEHYFENLLFDGKDIKNEPNKKSLSEIEQKTIEMCYQYVVFTLFFGREDFDRFLKERGSNDSQDNNI